MTIMGSVDIAFTNSTKIAKGAEQTATTAQETANGAAQTAGQAQETAETATQTATQAASTASTAQQTATQAAETASDAKQMADTAIKTADGKNTAYYGPYEPANPKSGDIWFVEDSSGNVTAIKHYDGTQWITDVDNTALEQQISAAQAAADNAATVGQAAQQTAADAEAKGDAAAKAAEEAKDAATKAQSDAASAVTSANNAVSTANQATQDAQNAISKAQDGFDAAQDALSTAGTAANDAKSALSTASTAAENAQSALTAANNATDTANTAKQVASDAATQASSALTQAQNAMAEAQKKADASSVYTKTEIDDALEGYATTTTVNTLTGRVDSAETAIQQNTNAIQLKADKSTVDTLTGRVSTAEATLTAQADQIAARITKADADAKYATQTALTATANSLTSSITAVQTNLDNLQIGGRNYAKGTATAVQVYGTGASNGNTSTPANSNFRKDPYPLSISPLSSMGLKAGDTITISYEWSASGTSVSGTFKAGFNASPWEFSTPVTLSSSNTSGRVEFTYTLTSNDPILTSTATAIRIRTDYVPVGTTITISNFKFEIGNRATDWTPAPEDLATQSQISQLVDDINLRVQKGDVINQINISTEGILIDGKKVHITGQTTIDNAVIKDAMIDSISANKLTAGTIDANVINVTNINASNIVTGTLDASKATVTNIDASNITTGTLSAARIASGSITSDKLSVSSLSAISANLGAVTAGSISGVSMNIGNGNFAVDTSGNLVAKSANIIGTITGSTINGSEFNSSGENGEIHIYDEFIESFEQISDIETSSAIISSGNFSQTYRVSSSIYKESSLAPGSLMIYDINSGETDITGGEITTAQINITSGFTASNGGGSIVLKNGDIVGINAIYLNDAANVDSEGLIFPWSTSTNVLDVTQADCLRAHNGRLLLNGDVVHTEKSMMIASGNVVITPSSGNTPTYKTVSFGKTFPVVPTVVVTPNSTVPGTTVTGWAVTDVTTTGCKIWVTRTNTTNTWLSWVAVADNTNWTATAVG